MPTYVDPLRRIEARRGRPADFIKPYLIQRGESVDLWLAVSGCERRANLTDSELWLRFQLQREGVRIGNVTLYEGGRYAQNSPRALRQASIEAKRQGRKLLAESADRFVRHPYFHSKERPNLQVDYRFDLEELRLWTHGAELVTWIDPSATPAQVRYNRTKRGHWAKGKRGGRGLRYRPFKARRERLIGPVQKLMAKGLDAKKIWRELSAQGERVTYRTVRRWVIRLGG
jgi:hypothetical protein